MTKSETALYQPSDQTALFGYPLAFIAFELSLSNPDQAIPTVEGGFLLNGLYHQGL
jgi:hypothetical protein